MIFLPMVCSFSSKISTFKKYKTSITIISSDQHCVSVFNEIFLDKELNENNHFNVKFSTQNIHMLSILINFVF